MVTVDYDYYKNVFGGTNISEERFPFMLRKANRLLSDITLGRSDAVTDEVEIADKVKDCLCEMCDTLQAYSSSDSPSFAIKKSETVSKWSVTYDTSNVPKSESSACLRVADTYIGDTELMCRWV